jgi:hypothetical protein
LGGRETTATQQYPYLSTLGPDLHKSQVFLSSINELHDELNPYDIQYQPSTLEEGIQFSSFMNTELSILYLILRNISSSYHKN